MHHLFVAEMRHGGLSGWDKQSRCVHAKARDLSSPFVRVNVALAVWCHGPFILFDHRRRAHLLFHIGTGELPAHNTSSFMHYSKAGPMGPWLPAPTTPGECMMPTAAFHPNGTIFAVCGNGATLTSAPTWDAEWGPQRPIGTPTRWEDPTHGLTVAGIGTASHYSLEPFHAHEERYGGHAFSRDGMRWTFSKLSPSMARCISPMEPSSGSPRVSAPSWFSRVEISIARLHAVCHSRPSTDWANVRLLSQQACSQCKVTPGRDWTFTLYQPLDVPDAA